MKYRCKIELAADLLSASLKVEKKTHIMNHGNFNFKQVNSYLNMLINAGLLCFDSESDSYYITLQGKKFLKIFRLYKRQLFESERKLAAVKEKKNQLEQMCSGPNGVQNSIECQTRNGKLPIKAV